MNQDFGRTLSQLRREKKISQRAAAEALGISQALLSHYENGIREPGLQFVTRACDFYHVSADYLLGRTMDRDGIVVQAPTTLLSDRARERRQAASASKPIISSLVLFFDLLSRTENPSLLNAASRYLSTGLYQLIRRLRLTAGISENRPLPSLPDEAFQAGLAEAELQLCRSRYDLELTNHSLQSRPFPDLSEETLARDYPASYPVFLELSEECSRRIAGHLSEDALVRKKGF